MRILFTAALLASAAVTPVLAQENAPFTGAHVEALAGYDAIGVGDADLDDSADGFLYGINAGYDFQLGGVIAGIEGEITDSTTKRRGNELLVVGDSARLDTDRDLYVGARLGFAAGPSTMIYAKAASNGQLASSGTLTAAQIPGGIGGALGGLISHMQANGAGSIANSGVGSGANMPINGAQLSQALGPDLVGKISASTGMTPDQILAQLSAVLPQVVDHLTPNGQMPR